MSTEEPMLEDLAPPGADEPLRRTLAEILNDIATDPARERVAVADLLSALEDRAFGALMLIFAIPNAIPAPPGTSAVLGAPLLFLAAQLTFGRKPWLPRVIANRSMLRKDFAALMGKAIPWITRAERLLRPRLVGLAKPPAEYLIGALCLLMSFILFLPIPLGNMLPAITICFFSLALLERDGIWVLGGIALSVISTLIVSTVVFGLVKAGLMLLGDGLF